MMDSYEDTYKQPCMTCTKYAGGCAWTRADDVGRQEFGPIEGWKIVESGKRWYKSKGGKIGIKILHCPEYDYDGTYAARCPMYSNGDIVPEDKRRVYYMRMYGFGQEQIARRMGKSLWWVQQVYKKLREGGATGA